MITPVKLLFSALLCIIVLFLAGCSPTVRTTATTAPSVPGAAPSSAEAMPPPPPNDVFDYEAANEDCQCKEYEVKDGRGVEYTFRANYKVGNAIITTIEIEFRNKGNDTLRLDPGVIKVESRNVAYRLNGKFLPLPDMKIAPGNSDHLQLDGQDMEAVDREWNKIAGEQLTVTIKGMRLGRHELSQQTVTFIPENPRMKER